MIKYYCDRCESEIRKEQFDTNPNICQFKEDIPYTETKDKWKWVLKDVK